MVTRGLFFEAVSSLGLSGISLKEEQVLAIKAVYGKSLCYQITPFVMEHKLGGDRAVSRPQSLE